MSRRQTSSPTVQFNSRSRYWIPAIELHFRITPHTAETRGPITTIQPRHLYCSYQRDGVWQTRGQRSFAVYTQITRSRLNSDLCPQHWTVAEPFPSRSEDILLPATYVIRRTRDVPRLYESANVKSSNLTDLTGVACRRDVQLLQFGTAKNSPLTDGGDNCREGGRRRLGDGGATTAAWLRRMAAAAWCQRIYLVLVVGDEQWLAARGAGSSASVLAQRRLTVSLHRQEYCNSALGAGACRRAAATTRGWRTESVGLVGVF